MRFKTKKIEINEFAEVAQDIERSNPIDNMRKAMGVLKSAVHSQELENDKEDKNIE